MKTGFRQIVPLLLAASCSYVFDEESPSIPLVGSPPPHATLPRLNRAPAGRAYSAEGVGGTGWVTFCEGAGRRMGRCTKMRAVQVRPAADPRPEDVFEIGDDGRSRIELRYRAFYQWEYPSAEETLLVIRTAGEAGEGTRFTLPGGASHVRIADGGDDDVFLYWLVDEATTSFNIYRRDMRYQRKLAIPDGVDSLDPYGAQIVFLQQGDRLLIRDGEGKVRIYSTLSEESTSLGEHPPLIALSEHEKLFWMVDKEEGLTRASLVDGKNKVVLHSGIKDLGNLWFTNGYAYYREGDTIWRTSLFGDEPEEERERQKVVDTPGMQRLLELGPNVRDVVYSRDPGDRYINGAGDAWLGEWRIMERGLWPSWSTDRKHMHWLENAAKTGAIGDLMSATMPAVPGGVGGPPEMLARNVRQFEEMSDGRVLAISNHALIGTFNRLITIDEERREAQWVVEGAHEYMGVWGVEGLFVDVVTGASGYNILHVPLPPKQK